MISIVIPMHNSQAYIIETLKSIGLQTYSDIEIILVDDNSTDNTVNLCKEFIKNSDKNIKIYSNPSTGVSSARNYGIKVARGEYIAFVDSDDLLHPRCYEFLERELSKDDEVEIVACGIDRFQDGKEYPINRPIENYESKMLKGGKEALESMVMPDKTLSVRGFANNKLYKRRVLRYIHFDEKLIMCEDSWFSWEVLKNVKKICLLKIPLYHYRVHNGSSTATADFKRNITALDAYSRMINDAVYGSIKLDNNIVDELIRQYIHWILVTAGTVNSFKYDLPLLEEYVDILPKKYKLCNASRLLKIAWTIYNTNKYIYVVLYKFANFVKLCRENRYLKKRRDNYE